MKKMLLQQLLALSVLSWVGITTVYACGGSSSNNGQGSTSGYIIQGDANVHYAIKNVANNNATCPPNQKKPAELNSNTKKSDVTKAPPRFTSGASGKSVRM